MRLRSLMGVALCAGGTAAEPMDLSLAEVVKLAQSRPVEVIAAGKRVDQALERLGQARSPLLPQLTATGQQSRQTRNLESQGITVPGRDPLVGPFNSFDARVKLTQALFDWGAIERMKSVKAGRRLSLADQEKVRQDTTALVATLYVEARRAKEKNTSAQAVLKRDEERLRLARVRLDNGTGTSLEASQAEAQLAQSRERVQAAESEALTTRLDLASALGYSPDQEFQFAEGEAPPPPPSGNESNIRVEVDGHPDVALVARTVEARRADLAAAKADRYPRLAASADYGFSGKTPADKDRTYAYGAQVSVPLFEGGRAEARSRETRKALEESEARLADAKLRVEARARSARESLERAWLFLKTQEEGFRVARQSRDLAATRLGSGVGSPFEMTQSDAELALAKDQRAEAEAGYQVARINWARALGRMELLMEGSKQ